VGATLYAVSYFADYCRSRIPEEIPSEHFTVLSQGTRDKVLEMKFRSGEIAFAK
jgi:hypothetical protein